MNTPPTDSPASQPLLPRILGPWTAGAILVGTVIGTGVFKKAAMVAKDVPESGPAILVWVAVGLLTLCGALALAEVAALFPQSGGNFVFLRQAYGPLFGFLWAWAEFWFLRCASMAALAVIFADSLHDVTKLALGTTAEVIGFWPRQIVASAVIVFLGLLSARGTRLGAGFQVVVTSVKVAAIVLITLLPLAAVLIHFNAPTRPDASRFDPVWPQSWSFAQTAAFAAAMVAVMWPYNGWTNVAPLAGEITNPQRNVPRAFIGGMLVLIVVYTGVNVSYFLAVPAKEMTELGGTPVATEVCYRLIGPVGLIAASAVLMLSVFGAIGGNMLVGPRSLFALGRSGMAPVALARLHPRYQTPFIATVLMIGVAVVFVFGGAAYSFFAAGPDGVIAKSPFDVITDFIVFGSAVLETLAVATVFVFRVTHPVRTTPRPFACPGYPVVPALYVLAMVYVMGTMFVKPEQRVEAACGLGLIAVGAGVYGVMWAVKRRKGVAPVA